MNATAIASDKRFGDWLVSHWEARAARDGFDEHDDPVGDLLCEIDLAMSPHGHSADDYARALVELENDGLSDTLVDALALYAESSAARAAEHADRAARSMRRAPLSSGVYFVRAGASGPIKIGRATLIRERVKALGTASPEPLSFLGHVEGGADEEACLHARFGLHRLRGEWFAPAPELLNFIQTEATKP